MGNCLMGRVSVLQKERKEYWPMRESVRGVDPGSEARHPAALHPYQCNYCSQLGVQSVEEGRGPMGSRETRGEQQEARRSLLQMSWRRKRRPWRRLRGRRGEGEGGGRGGERTGRREKWEEARGMRRGGGERENKRGRGGVCSVQRREEMAVGLSRAVSPMDAIQGRLPPLCPVLTL